MDSTGVAVTKTGDASGPPRGRPRPAPAAHRILRTSQMPKNRQFGGKTMRATLIYGAGDVRIEDVPDPVLREPTDALVRVVRSCICGSDLWPYGSRPATGNGDRIGHEFLGVVAEVGRDVSGLAAGDLVVAPFVWADNTCDFCREGLQTSCRHGGMWADDGVDGGQGEAV